MLSSALDEAGSFFLQDSKQIKSVLAITSSVQQGFKLSLINQTWVRFLQFYQKYSDLSLIFFKKSDIFQKV